MAKLLALWWIARGFVGWILRSKLAKEVEGETRYVCSEVSGIDVAEIGGSRTVVTIWYQMIKDGKSVLCEVSLEPKDLPILIEDLILCDEIVNEGFEAVKEETLKPQHEIYASVEDEDLDD